MTGESMADRRYSLLQPDRGAQLAHMRQRIAELGADEESRQLEASISEWLLSEGPTRYSDPPSAFMHEMTIRLKPAMADLGVDPDRLATVRVGMTLQEDVSAQMQPFADGSGLVLVSDSVFSLAIMYSQYAAAAYSRISSTGRLRTFWRIAQAGRAGGLGEDPALLTGLLRYYNINQRVYGVAGKLGMRMEKSADDMFILIFAFASRFVVGHELAHHVLGHSSATSGFSPGEHLPVCSENEQRELDADMLAYRAAVRSFDLASPEESDLAETSDSGVAKVWAMLGALVALLVIHSTEQALFIRRGCSHPPAPVRAAQLIDLQRPGTQTVARLFLSNMLAATDASSSFTGSTVPLDWTRFAAEPRVITPLRPEVLDDIARFDALLCQPTSAAVAALERVDARYSVPLSEGARLAANGKTGAALRAWRVQDHKIDQLCDHRHALAFHTLVEAIAAPLGTLAMPLEPTQWSAVVAASLAATTLR